MDEDHSTWQRLQGLARLAVLQLESGRIARETQEIVRACAAGLKLENVTVITLGCAVVVQHTTPDGRDLAVTREVAVSTGINCEQARSLDDAAVPIAGGDVAPEQVENTLDAARVTPQPWYVAVLALSVVAASIALQFGVEPTGALFTGLLEFLVAGSGVLLARARLGVLFAATAQAELGGVVALVAASTGLVPWVAAVASVAVSWVVLVPQPAVVASAADAVDGEYPASAARGAVVLMTLVGVAIGAGCFIQLSAHYAPARLGDVVLPTLMWPLVIFFSGLGAVANAFANGGGRRLVGPAAVIGMGTGVCNLLLGRVWGLDVVLAKTLVAIVLGVVATLVARRVGYPAAVLMLMGITGALLPGDVVYTAIMKHMHGGSGLGDLLRAGVICFGLGAGAAFGAKVTALVQHHRAGVMTGVARRAAFGTVQRGARR